MLASDLDKSWYLIIILAHTKSMERLSAPLLCLTLQHVIDQPDVAEELLREYPQIERCVPLALKEVFDMPTIPDTVMTFKYVRALWHQLPELQDIKDKYLASAREGLIYLLPYIIPHPDIYTISEAVWAAIEGRQLDTIKYLLSLIVPNKRSLHIIRSSLTAAGGYGFTEAMKYILSWMASNYSPEQINDAISHHVLLELEVNRLNVQFGATPGNIDAITSAQTFLSSVLNHPEKWKR